MKFLVNRQIKKALKLFEKWEIEEANAILSDLDTKYPKNDKIKFHFAVTQNSLGNKDKALELLEDCLRLNPKNEDASTILTSIILNTADSYEKMDLIKLKPKFLILEKRGYEDIGLDLATVYEYLADISESEGNLKEAERYLNLAKSIYTIDNFLKECHIDSGRIDLKIEALKN